MLRLYDAGVLARARAYVSLQSLLSTVTRTVGAPGEEKGRRVGVVGGLCCLRGYVVHDFTAG